MAPVSICFFNNKGGVGKTTLACNVASYLAQHKSKSVLVVDADPQCNATQLILPEDLTEQLYSLPNPPPITTLKDILAPINAGEASPKPPFTPAAPDSNRFGVSIFPGHPSVALLEDRLSQSWTNFIGGNLGGARVSNWNTEFLRHQGAYDIIIYDVGPSLGALNRSVLIGVDFFVAPMGCDIFSLIGIDNIAGWLDRWQRIYNNSYILCKDNDGAELTNHNIKPTSQHMSRFLGYTVQQYITKTIRNKRRPTAAYEKIMTEIPDRIASRLQSVSAPPLSPANYRLGDVPHMFSLVPLAQTAHAPILDLNSNDGLSGGQFGQLKAYKSFIATLSDSLLANLQATRGSVP